MPTERIKITAQEFKTTSADGQTTFSSNNKYYKTTPTGAFRVGGFERAPFIAGLEYAQDKVWLGGYLQRLIPESQNLARITVPFNDSVVTYTALTSKLVDQFTPGSGISIMTKQLRYAINITNGYGTPYYLAVYYGAYPGAPTTKFPWGLVSTYVTGTYIFDGSPLGNYWDQQNPQPWLNNGMYQGPYNANDLVNVPWDTRVHYNFTQANQNIDLAVTI